jgi:maltose alpha-D-glucosyltransferase/alpha-amylase
MLLAEANQRPEHAAAYLGRGDEAHMAFHFPLMPRMFMAAAAESRWPIEDVLSRTPPIPPACQWALFLRNHDELSLEMVTEDERERLYRAYAGDPRGRLNLGIRRRLAPLLGNDRRLIELMTGLLFSLPGTPVLYYGDEIGMGDDLSLPDRSGIRTPMQWGSGPGAGFSPAPLDRLYLPVILDHGYGPRDVNVRSQRGDRRSLWHSMRRLIALRRRFPVLGRGTLRLVETGNSRVLGFFREQGGERLLVLANLAGARQEAAVDLAPHRGGRVREVLGSANLTLPPSGPVHLSLAPHGLMWLSPDTHGPRSEARDPRVLETAR